ncbi:MAG TPA: hypothetical protein PKC91_15145 [Ignavibacteria bacterium]|nr:hypothetical protein [Ignavibacteria bacterium]
MKILKSLTIIIPLLLSIIYSSCSDPLTGTTGVSGVVRGYNEIPVSSLTLRIGDDYARTADDGSFSFKKVYYPYDLVIYDSTFDIGAIIYKNLSADKLNLFIDRYVNSQSYAQIRIHMPVNFNNGNYQGKAFFTNGQDINANTGIGNSFSNSLYIHTKQPEPVTGKIIVLIYSKDINGKIVSYNNYGESPQMTLQPGTITDYTFDSLSLTLNPGEENISGSFDIEGYNDIRTYYYISFGNTGNTDYYEELGYFSGWIFNFKIPSGLPLNFKTYIINNTHTGLGSSYETFPVYPSVPNNFTIKDPCTLITPENGSESVNSGTVFSFSSGSGNGIHIVSLNNISRYVNFKIFTDKTNFTLEGLDQLGLGYINNNNFRWDVQEAGPSGSLNDYVVNNINREQFFSTTSVSKEFTTMP